MHSSLRLGLVLLGTASTLALGSSIGCGSDGDSTFEDGGASSSGSSSGQPPITVPDGSGGGDGSSGGASGTPGVITVTLRDFQHWVEGDETRNPDFQNEPELPPGESTPYYGPWTESPDDYVAIADDGTATPTAPEWRTSIVMPDLGADGKPVYDDSGEGGRTATTHGKAAFDQWYRDVPGVNMKVELPLTLEDLGNGVYSYDSAKSGVPRQTDGLKQFFPLDGKGFGNTPESVAPSLDHNYHFTMELHTRFTYAGNETFRFTGDDDIFVFINKKLVINIGGIHAIAQKEIDLAAIAASIGLEVGKEYPFDLFQAERRIIGSNVRLDTTIKLRPSIPN